MGTHRRPVGSTRIPGIAGRSPLPALALAALFPLAAVPAAARTWRVPDEAASIQAGIAAAAAGDTVLVACGVYHESWITLADSVTVRSETGQPDCATADAGGSGLVFYAEHTGDGARLEGFTVTGGQLAAGCGGLYAEGVALAIRDCRFAGNAAPGGGGGGLGATGADLVLERCAFEGNEAEVGGGAYLVGSTLALTDCTFAGNTADRLGGGLACHDVDCAAAGGLIANNVCLGAGGGAYWTYSDDVTLAAVTFRGNAALAGGGLFVEDFTAPALVDCVFAGNTATTHGGALVCYHDPPLTGCSFEANTAGGFGGALFLGGSPTLTACSLRDNAADKGGALACLGMQGAGLLTLTECVLDGNEAGFQGGAVWLGASDGAVHLAAADTDFGLATAPIGTTGFLQGGCTALLHCCATEPDTWVGGAVTVDDTGCGIAAQPASWGRLKALYAD